MDEWNFIRPNPEGGNLTTPVLFMTHLRRQVPRNDLSNHEFHYSVIDKITDARVELVNAFERL